MADLVPHLPMAGAAEAEKGAAAIREVSGRALLEAAAAAAVAAKPVAQSADHPEPHNRGTARVSQETVRRALMDPSEAPTIHRSEAMG